MIRPTGEPDEQTNQALNGLRQKIYSVTLGLRNHLNPLAKETVHKFTNFPKRLAFESDALNALNPKFGASKGLNEVLNVWAQRNCLSIAWLARELKIQT